MKGQQEVLTPVLLTGIMIAIVASVYFWGMPLINKNKDTLYLKKSEIFMNDLADEIKYVASNGGREEITFDIPGTFRFFPDDNYIEMNITTDGTIYSSNGELWFVMPSSNVMNGEYGVWGKDEPYELSAYTRPLENKYMTSYHLRTIPLCSGSRCYEIDLVGNKFTVGGGNHKIIIESNGITEPQVINGNEFTYSRIKISFL